MSTENRLSLVLNVMLFLYNHAFNTEAMKDEEAKRSSRPCRVVLTRQFNLMSPKGNQDHEVPIGLILKLARDSLHRIHVSTNISISAKAAQCHASIAEIALTLAYHHAEMFTRDPSLGAFEPGADEIERRNFQQELRSTVEEYFAIDLGLHVVSSNKYLIKRTDRAVAMNFSMCILVFCRSPHQETTRTLCYTGFVA